jgi:hypothetical protein
MMRTSCIEPLRMRTSFVASSSELQPPFFSLIPSILFSLNMSWLGFEEWRR